MCNKNRWRNDNFGPDWPGNGHHLPVSMDQVVIAAEDVIRVDRKHDLQLVILHVVEGRRYRRGFKACVRSTVCASSWTGDVIIGADCDVYDRAVADGELIIQKWIDRDQLDHERLVSLAETMPLASA
jgi:hypothetical protein